MIKERTKSEAEVAFDKLFEKFDEWYKEHPNDMCDPPIDAQFALNVIFEALVNDQKHYSYLTTMPESQSQVNAIMVDKILTMYSDKYREYKYLWNHPEEKGKKKNIFVRIADAILEEESPKNRI